MTEEYDKVQIKRYDNGEWITESGMGNLKEGDYFVFLSGSFEGRMYQAESDPYMTELDILGVEATEVNENV